MSDYRVESSEKVYQGALSDIRLDHVRMPDGSSADREVVEHPDAVAIVALDEQGRVLLLRHYRHPIRQRLLELPAGKRDQPREDAAAAAARELQEEAGLRAGRLSPLIRFHNSAGWTDESTSLFLAEDLEESGVPDGFTAQHEEADIELVWVPLDEAVSMVAGGEIADAKTIIGVLLTRLQRGVH
jgi:8-oxo-dGTP pyrophosphatase MutT (NUDIX family)